MNRPKMSNRFLPVVYCYSGAVWSDYPGRQFALMKALAKKTDVYFLNHPVIKGRIAEFRIPTSEKIEDGLTVIHNAFTFRLCRSGKHLGALGAFPDSIVFHRLLRQLGVEDYIFWLSTPMKSLLRGMRAKHLIYDCIDPAPDDGLHGSLHSTETRLARQSSAIICTAENLQARLQPLNPHCYLVPNAAGPRDFPEAGPRLVPEPLQKVKGPTVGYVGTVDFRIDFTTLIAVARQMPDLTFVVAGHIRNDSPAAVEELRSLPNVILPGNINDEESRNYIAAFDLGIIPFNAGIMGDGINPVKMYMYLAAGKPVVSTWMQECRRHAPLVVATKNVEDFVVAIREELRTNTPEKVAARINFARQNTWDARAEQVAGIFSKLNLYR